MVEVRLLLLGRVVHSFLLAGLLGEQGLLLVVDDLLVLLRQVARGAAAGAQAVCAAVALEVVLSTDVAAVDHGENEGDAEARKAAECSALGAC